MSSKGLRRTAGPVWLGVAVLLCGTAGQAAGQSSAEEARAQVAVTLDAARWAGVVQLGSGAQDVPPDVRIMQTIVRTALSGVPQPEPAEEAAEGGEAALEARARNLYVSALPGRSSFFGGRGDVSGFYMEGYGYLFTVRWPVSSLSAVRIQDGVVVGRGGDRAQPSPESTARAEQHRARLADALRDVIAGYGSTLRRARAGESITFIADFGAGDDETVTMTVRADALQGSDVDANRGAIRISTGQGETSERLRTQLRIMSEIVDASLRSGGGDDVEYVFANAYFGGSADPRYVPGYGVIFRKNARMNTSRVFVDVGRRSSTRAAVDSTQAAAQERYRAHLDTLRQKTAEILATYGPTLTEMQDDDWVGLYYDVGSAAGLLSGGMDDYLVQARMRDVRQAAGQGDPAGWLAQRVVTNEKEE